MPASSRVESVTSFDRLRDFAEDWDRLWQEAPRREVFTSFPWAQAWWEAYGDAHDLVALVVFRSPRPAAIFPLVRRGSRILPLGWSRNDYWDFLCEPGFAGEALRAAISFLDASVGRWSRLVLSNVPEPSHAALAAIEMQRTKPRRIRVQPGNRCSSARRLPEDPEVFDRLTRNKHLLRKEKRLAKHGPVESFCLEDRDAIRAELPEFFRQHIERWSRVAGASTFTDAANRQFYERLVEHLDPRSTLRFLVLRAGAVPVAHHLGFEVDGRFLCYKPAFDGRYAQCSPGEVMFRRVFDYVKSRSLEECDFTIGEESFKERFANSFCRNLDITIYAPGARGASARAFDLAREFAKRQVRGMLGRRRGLPPGGAADEVNADAGEGAKGP